MERKAYLRYLELAHALFIALLLVLPIVSNAQNTATLKRMYSVRTSYEYSGIGPDSHGYNTIRFFYDPVDRFLINTYRTYGAHYDYDELIYSWDETYPFAGYTQLDADHFAYTTPTMKVGCARTCAVDNNGYILEDNFGLAESAQDYIVTNHYTYNSDMKLISKLRSHIPSGLYWKTDCTLDSLDRRIEEISYKSLDSINWTPTNKVQYTYTGEQHIPPPEFEKYSMYLPDYSFYLASAEWNRDNFFGGLPQPLYLCDNWTLGTITMSRYENQEWMPYLNSGLNLSHGVDGYYATFLALEYISYHWDNNGTPISISGAEEGSNTYEYYFSTPTEISDQHEDVPSAFSVTAYPNPNRGETQLTLHTDKQEQITVCTYNIRGQKVKDQTISAIPHKGNSLSWSATDTAGKPLPNGVYILKIVSPSHRETKKITVAK